MCDVRPAAALLQGRGLSFRPLRAADLLEIAPIALFPTQYGLPVAELSFEEADNYASGRFAFGVRRGDRAVAALGVAETFEGTAGLAWAFLSAGLTRREKGEVTRFARDVVIGANPLPRIEAVVRCGDVEAFLADNPACAEPGVLLDIALQVSTPQVRWALGVGLSPVAVLRKFGAAGETHMLLERII